MKLCDLFEYKEFIEAKEKYTKNSTSGNYIKMQSLRDGRLTYEEFCELKAELFE